MVIVHLVELAACSTLWYLEEPTSLASRATSC